MSNHPRRILTPGASTSRKRKEREAHYSLKPSIQSASSAAAAKEPAASNRLLAGYMAYEFLTKGTLLGQKFDPGRAEAVPVGSHGGGEWRKTTTTKMEVKTEASLSMKKEHESYGEVASILKADGVHIPGIVNPTQLARWIQM
ncbi:uncharacterized protein LOC107411873 [Ziziphus jujuba]|nr:uncharacterized protein LOC107411873 [Ziziphus jujuba]